MAIAPSEKHLEDWIVANPELVGWQEAEPDEYWDGVTRYLDRIVIRQAVLPAGICDLIAVTGQSFEASVAAVELKRRIVDSAALAQCLRYMCDLHQVFYHTRVPLYDEIPDETMWMEYPANGIVDSISGSNWPEVTGLIIGHALQDKNLLIAAEAAYVRILLYDYDDGDYSFTAPSELSYGQAASFDYRNHQYRYLSGGSIGDAIREIVRDRFRNGGRA